VVVDWWEVEKRLAKKGRDTHGVMKSVYSRNSDMDDSWEKNSGCNGKYKMGNLHSTKEKITTTKGVIGLFFLKIVENPWPHCLVTKAA